MKCWKMKVASELFIVENVSVRSEYATCVSISKTLSPATDVEWLLRLLSVLFNTDRCQNQSKLIQITTFFQSVWYIQKLDLKVVTGGRNCHAYILTNNFQLIVTMDLIAKYYSIEIWSQNMFLPNSKWMNKKKFP